MQTKRILCPVDFSEGSRAALEVAAELAREAQAVLVLVHVWERPVWVTGYTPPMAGTNLSALRAAEETKLVASKLHAQALGASEVQIRCFDGTPWHRIVAFAREDAAIDLVVMGTHGRTGIQRALIGSVAERVVRHAPCTVMVVRPRAVDARS